MPRVLSWKRAFPSLGSLLHRHLATVDEQAIAFPLTLAAYSPVPQSRATAALAGRRQFLIHLVGLIFGSVSKQGPLAVVSPLRAPTPALTRLPPFVHARSCQKVYLARAASPRWLELLPLGLSASARASATLPSGRAEKRQFVMPVTSLLIERATNTNVRDDIPRDGECDDKDRVSSCRTTP